ncbi:MAG: hypothetical protein SGI72_14400 [Planctomycetota bacterium]|nr:hypothetical protein [Planctomycetota bacterium]
MSTSPNSVARLSWLRQWGTLGVLTCAGCAHEQVAVPSAPPAIAAPASWAGTLQGTNEWVSGSAGDLPVVISVPHGGSLKPAEILDRTRGETTMDSRTIELATAIIDAFRERTGRAPYVIVCKLHRRKLDANRDVTEAAAGNVDAERAWREYHAFVDTACADVQRRFGGGLYIDLHGHAHAMARLELGYLLSARELDATDADIAELESKSSLSALRRHENVSFAALLRGPTSIGGLLSSEFDCVPSPATPSPGANAYFNGGFSTRVHTRVLPGLQIEAPLIGVRDTAENRARFGRALSIAVETFLETHANTRF